MAFDFFRRFDKNGDGTIYKRDLCDALAAFGCEHSISCSLFHYSKLFADVSFVVSSCIFKTIFPLTTPFPRSLIPPPIYSPFSFRFLYLSGLRLFPSLRQERWRYDLQARPVWRTCLIQLQTLNFLVLFFINSKYIALGFYPVFFHMRPTQHPFPATSVIFTDLSLS